MTRQMTRQRKNLGLTLKNDEAVEIWSSKGGHDPSDTIRIRNNSGRQIRIAVSASETWQVQRESSGHKKQQKAIFFYARYEEVEVWIEKVAPGEWLLCSDDGRRVRKEEFPTLADAMGEVVRWLQLQAAFIHA